MNKIGILKQIKCPTSYEDTLNESEIIGIMLGDGHITPDNRSIRLRVRELDFAKNFKTLIESTYGIFAPLDNKYYYNCYAHSTLLTQRIINLTKRNKEIPEFVLNGTNEIKARFLRGFFDSEGSFDTIYNRRQIVLTQNNQKMLLQIQKLLFDINIQSKYVTKRTGSDKLIISLLENLKKYGCLVGFAIEYKREKLREAISYLEKCKPHDKEKYWDVLRHWLNTKKSLRGSAKERLINWETYRSWVYGMKIPCQIKKDIEWGLVPEDYDILREKYSFLPKIKTT
jgi:intein/homing endonuclease